MTDLSADPAPIAPPAATPAGPERIYRHRLPVRISHWINVLALSLLLMSGLQIFNSHPRLYWGQYGADFDAPFLEIDAAMVGGKAQGRLSISTLTLNTTGVLGLSDVKGTPTARGFPSWATIPSYHDLATGRRWHFFLAWIFVINGAVYLAWGFFSGHFRRDVAPTKDEVKPRHLLKDLWDHARLKRIKGEAARRYNPIQKLTYIAVIFVILPLMVLTGLTMSPGVNAALPFMLDLFGGRQTARSLHFITANLIVLFVIVHVVEVFIAGVWNEMRSMITGWFVVEPEARDAEV